MLLALTVLLLLLLLLLMVFRSLLNPPAIQLFPYHIRLRGPPSPSTAPVDRGLWFCKPFYTGNNEGGVIMATWPELQVRDLGAHIGGTDRLTLSTGLADLQGFDAWVGGCGGGGHCRGPGKPWRWHFAAPLIVVRS